MNSPVPVSPKRNDESQPLVPCLFCGEETIHAKPEMFIKYFVVEQSTQNPSADDSWDFRSEIAAKSYADERRKICAQNPDYYGDTLVRVYERSIVFCDDE